MTLDEELLRQARDASTRWAAAQDQADIAKADYHHAVRRLHTAGGSLREIAEALALSHQRVHQITTGKVSGASCSFCGKSSDHVGKLVAGQSALICDSCVQGAAGNHEGACAFCGETTTVFGVKAKICDGCLALAREVIGAASPR